MAQTGSGIGHSVPRKEDDRYLRGRGEFIADIRLAGMQDLAFVRSPLAHARIRGIHMPADAAGTHLHRGRPRRSPDAGRFRPARLQNLRPAHPRARQGAPCRRADRRLRRRHPRRGRRPCRRRHHRLRRTSGGRRHAGSPPPRRAAGARALGRQRLPGNRGRGRPDRHPRRARRSSSAAASAPRGNACRRWKAAASSRSGTAGWNSSWSTAPRNCRTSSAPGWPNASASTKAGSASSRPMSAAASATRASCWPRKWCAGWLARRLGHPVRWIEDRREQLTGNANCREHQYEVTAYADADGRLLALDAEATVDAGAYSAYPFSACLEAAQVASILPGPYMMDAYRCRTWSAATNKPPILPYRGVARAGVCFVMELMIDAIAREAGLRTARGPAAQPGAARRDAVRQHHQETFRQRRLSRMPAPRRRRDRPRPPSAPARRRKPARSAPASACRSSASRARTAPRSTPAGASR